MDNTTRRSTLAIGDRFGRWTIVGDPVFPNQRCHLPVQCDCGFTSIVLASNLTRGLTRGCGCSRPEPANAIMYPEIGAVFGSWTIVRKGESDEGGRRRVYCRCKCGVERLVLLYAILKKRSCGCGCARPYGVRTHGETIGGVQSAEFTAWESMHDRCSRPGHTSWNRYGGRGIQVCAEWETFERFLADMGRKPSPEHSLDRYPDNDGPYAPWNCRWATPLEQSANRSPSIWIEYQGERAVLAEWSRRTGIRATTIRDRLRSGWTIEEALTRPTRWRVNRVPSAPVYDHELLDEDEATG